MNPFQTATAFFHACEGLEGWAGCQAFVVPGATFTAQSEPLAELATVEEYCEWMAGLGKGPLAGCSYDLHSAAWDQDNSTALFFATFNGKHDGEGGPVPPTGKATHSHYVYAITIDDSGKVSAMTKIWNAPWAMREMGWA